MIISQATVLSENILSPSRAINGKAIVNYFLNKDEPSNFNKYVKVSNVSVNYANGGVDLFAANELSVETLRTIANALNDLANKADAAAVKLREINKSIDTN